MTLVNPDSPSAIPDPKKRRRAQIGIAAFLAFQLLMPLTYYFRDNPYDERFAWRMFSAVRMYQCNVQMREGSSDSMVPVRLGRIVHQAWINHLRRNRDSVALRLLEQRCEIASPNRVEIQTQCQDATGTPIEPTLYLRNCESQESQIRRGTE